MRLPAFPLDRIDDIQAKPASFKMLEEIAQDLPLPIIFEESEGEHDEGEIIFIDTETTGLHADSSEIIELGLIMCKYSKSRKCLLRMEAKYSFLEQPSEPMDDEVIGIHGITNEMLEGHSFPDKEIAEIVKNDPIMCPHNARFDRPFWDKRFPELSGLRWACSYQEIPWRNLNFEGGNLTCLLMQCGYFIAERHRALADCYMLAWLLYFADNAVELLLDSMNEDTIRILTYGSPFRVKDCLKHRKYSWDGKVWSKDMREHLVEAEMDFLDNLYANARGNAVLKTITARERYAS